MKIAGPGEDGALAILIVPLIAACIDRKLPGTFNTICAMPGAIALILYSLPPDEKTTLWLSRVVLLIVMVTPLLGYLSLSYAICWIVGAFYFLSDSGSLDT